MEWPGCCAPAPSAGQAEQGTHQKTPAGRYGRQAVPEPLQGSLGALRDAIERPRETPHRRGIFEVPEGQKGSGYTVCSGEK